MEAEVTVELVGSIRDRIVAHAVACAPEEACGLASAAAVGEPVDGFHPVTNSAVSPMSRFVLDPAEMLQIERAVKAQGRTVIGVVHSHPTTPAEPSPTDRADAAGYDPDGIYVQLIVSLAAEPVELAAFCGPDLDRCVITWTTTPT